MRLDPKTSAGRKRDIIQRSTHTSDAVVAITGLNVTPADWALGRRCGGRAGLWAGRAGCARASGLLEGDRCPRECERPMDGAITPILAHIQGALCGIFKLSDASTRSRHTNCL